MDRRSQQMVKPRDLFLMRLGESAIPALEREGFRFATSRLRFARAQGDFRHAIHVALDRNNFEDDCSFWTIWEVTSPAYARWYRAEWGGDDAPDAVASAMDWDVPGWTGQLRRRLTGAPGDVEVMAGCGARRTRIPREDVELDSRRRAVKGEAVDVRSRLGFPHDRRATRARPRGDLGGNPQLRGG